MRRSNEVISKGLEFFTSIPSPVYFLGMLILYLFALFKVFWNCWISPKVGKNGYFDPELFCSAKTLPRHLVVLPTNYTWTDSPTIRESLWILQKLIKLLNGNGEQSCRSLLLKIWDSSTLETGCSFELFTKLLEQNQ